MLARARDGGCHAGHVFDKKHTFAVTNMGDFDEILQTGEEWEPPSDKDFEDKEVLNWWLMDKACRVRSVSNRPQMHAFILIHTSACIRLRLEPLSCS